MNAIGSDYQVGVMNLTILEGECSGSGIAGLGLRFQVDGHWLPGTVRRRCKPF